MKRIFVVGALVTTVGCMTSSLEVVQPIRHPVQTVWVELPELPAQHGPAVLKSVERALRDSGITISDSQSPEVPVARAEFGKYYRGNGFLRAVTVNIAGRFAIESTWTIINPATGTTLGVCQINGRNDISAFAWRRVLHKMSSNLAKCLSGGK